MTLSVAEDLQKHVERLKLDIEALCAGQDELLAAQEVFPVSIIPICGHTGKQVAFVQCFFLAERLTPALKTFFCQTVESERVYRVHVCRRIIMSALWT